MSIDQRAHTVSGAILLLVLGLRVTLADDAAFLANKLASMNPPPEVTEFEEFDLGTKVTYKPGYSNKEKERVEKATDDLLDKLDDVWRDLPKHFDDNRYSRTRRNVSNLHRNQSVGTICRSAFETSVNAYRTIFELQGPSDRKWRNYYFEVVSNGEGHPSRQVVERWIKKHEKQELWEIQVEVAEWAFNKMKESPHSDTTVAEMEGKLKEFIANREKEKKALRLRVEF